MEYYITQKIPYRIHGKIRRTLFVPKYHFESKIKGDGFFLNKYKSNGVIFVHIPKTGGISVSQSLFGCDANHLSARDYRAIFGEPIFNKYFKFAFVRNPWNRVYSAYVFLKSGGMNKKDSFWSKEYLQDYDGFTDFVKKWINKSNIYKGIHFVPQHEFICDHEGEVIVDFVGKLENMQSDFKFVCETIGIDRELLHLNKKEKKSYKEIYDPESKDIVFEAYKKDIELFGYEF